MTFKIQSMGVMNITPNSFSDGGRFLGPKAMIDGMDKFQSLGVDYLDIGAESTAPMNDSISFQEEWLRLQTFLTALSERKWHGLISLDSYRPKTAFAFFKECLRLGYTSDQMVWNDVSGSFDEEVETFLTDFPLARYVFCHNLAPSREESSAHMEYCEEDITHEEFFGKMGEFFAQNLKKMGSFKERVILDPCFGFSKTYEQNLFLLKNFSKLWTGFPEHSFVYGISKKSFLRQWWSEHIEDGSREFLLKKSEFLHLFWLQNLVTDLGYDGTAEASIGASKTPKELILRVHDPSLVAFLRQIPKQ